MLATHPFTPPCLRRDGVSNASGAAAPNHTAEQPVLGDQCAPPARATAGTGQHQRRRVTDHREWLGRIEFGVTTQDGAYTTGPAAAAVASSYT